MKTRERILQASLQLFNEHGEPNVSTNHIADEMDISPGNLYYHFRNKDDIINCLFTEFEKQISDALEAPTARALNMEDMWLYLHLVFESIWRYRFIYRDLDNILMRNRRVRLRFRRILERKVQTAVVICKGLVDAGIMRASLEETEALANNIAVVATYWLNFKRVRTDTRSESGDIGRGVYQVMTLVSPFLIEEMRDLLYRLSRDYLE